MNYLFAAYDLLAPQILLGLIPIVMFLVWLVSILANSWLKYKKAEMNAALKQDMIQRGMSADDIVRVLSAGKSDGAASSGQGQAVSRETTDFKRV